MKILAIDPGDFSGWVDALVLYEEPWLQIDGWAEVSPSFRQGWLENLDQLLAAGIYEAVFIEDFRPVGGRKTWHPAALHIIGTVIYLTAKYGVPLKRQQPSASQKFATPAKLEPFTKGPPYVGRGARDDDAISALRNLILGRMTTIPLNDDWNK